MAPVAVTFPPFVTASRWSLLVDNLMLRVMAKRGPNIAPGASEAKGDPPLTNGDVIKLTMAWLAAIPRARVRQAFPLWHQFAAVAYGWDPKSNRFTTTATQRAARYPDVLTSELWGAMFRAAGDLDDNGVANARIDLDGDFADPVFQGEVKSALRDDGVVDVQFGIPLPVCRGKDGKPEAPKCKRRMQRWPFLCEEWEKCAPVIITDPITDIKKKSDKALLLVALIVAAWAMFDNRRGSRRK